MDRDVYANTVRVTEVNGVDQLLTGELSRVSTRIACAGAEIDRIGTRVYRGFERSFRSNRR